MANPRSGSKPLEDYGLIGNMISAALVAREGVFNLVKPHGPAKQRSERTAPAEGGGARTETGVKDSNHSNQPKNRGERK